MDSKELRLLGEAYAGIQEGYGKKEEKEEKEEDCVPKSEKGEHNCAKKVCHEQFGQGTCIFGEHAEPDRNGFVSHYDVMFEHGIERGVPTSEMEILVSESHGGHGKKNNVMAHYEAEGKQISEGPEEYSGGQHPSQSRNKADRDRYETETRRRQAPKNVGVPDKSVGYGQLQQSVDLFDIVKGHLMSEGYADTEEAALAIMANMSEEWRQSIIEGPVGEFADNVARTAGTAVGTVQRGVDYLRQKGRNVAGTFEYARDRAAFGMPFNTVGPIKQKPRGPEFSHGGSGQKKASSTKPIPIPNPNRRVPDFVERRARG